MNKSFLSDSLTLREITAIATTMNEINQINYSVSIQPVKNSTVFKVEFSEE